MEARGDGQSKDEFPVTWPIQGAAEVPRLTCATELRRNPEPWFNTTWRRASSAVSSCGPPGSFSKNGVF